MNIIISPHPDDEIIGCYEILRKDLPCLIIYSSETEIKRREETANLRKYFKNITSQLFSKNIPPHLINKENIFYFPDHIYESHPLHRLYGMQGETLVRNGFDVIFYSINMLAPYVHESSYAKEKERILNLVYPSQRSLWRYEKKYVLFEGYCKWLM